MKARVQGHFGEWLQGRFGADGAVVLLTVPCSRLYLDVERIGDGPLALVQSTEVLALPRARDVLARVAGREGVYRVTASMPPGGGAGASTAALIALAQAAGGKRHKVTEACLAVEGASDPLMLSRPDSVLWASREGRVVRDVPPLPEADIVGGFWGPPEATDPADTRFADISDLVAKLKPNMPLAELADIASTSARRCTALRGPTGDPTERLAADLGALGHLRAHTGSARGLIFAPGTAPTKTKTILKKQGFKQIINFST